MRVILLLKTGLLDFPIDPDSLSLDSMSPSSFQDLIDLMDDLDFSILKK
jgi:hypothetical protein